MTPYKTAAQRKAERERELYEAEVGKAPDNRFADDPDWLYSGSKAERDALRRQFMADAEAEEAPVFIEGQTDLLGDAA